ncbi:MAG: 1-deoxy-D-xylulose-5-phosphate reductoisomerase [Hyphomicrobiaceae bacterium]|nr:1-deoxy-D-xylulose-5-phosphate reductoisomerase [Hyphomicrobiaceae bacterium]
MQFSDRLQEKNSHCATVTDIQTVSILGATGSIGTNTLDLIARSADRFQIESLTAYKNVSQLAKLAKVHNAKFAVIGDETKYKELKSYLAGTSIEIGSGETGLIEAGARQADCTIASIIGSAGLRPSIEAVRQGHRVALANKECLVAAGDVFMSEVSLANAELLPLDSEHAAIHQVLCRGMLDEVKQIIITASGGPFRNWTAKQITAATPEQALRHPNWSMGAKISIDSSTLMNKGLELIEAHHLFAIEPERLKVIIHPQSVVHCLISYYDGSVIAQMANPDMRTPIAYCLAWPGRMASPTEPLDLIKLQSLTFEAPDTERFPALDLAISALIKGGSAPNIMNAANECAVAAFLAHEISFTDITRIVEKCLEKADQQNLLQPVGTIDEVLALDHEARQLVGRLIDQN